MIQAGCENMIDYRTAKLHDPKWWQKLWHVLNYVERKNRIKLNEYRFQCNLAALDYGASQQTFDLHWEQAMLARNGLINDILLTHDKLAQSTGQIVDQLRDKWIEKWGDPASPETRENMQALLDHWEAVRKKGKPTNGRI